jgi:hypothetical protein
MAEKRISVDVRPDLAQYRAQINEMLHHYAYDEEEFAAGILPVEGDTKTTALRLNRESLELLDVLTYERNTTRKNLINAVLEYGSKKPIFRRTA